MPLSAATIATSIAALDVSGVTMRDLDEVSTAVDARACPVLEPSVNDPPFMTGLSVERASFQGQKDIRYTLNYKLYHSPVGSGRSLLDKYPDLVEKTLAVWDAMISNDALTGCIDNNPEDMPQFGPVVDASGNQFHGAVLSLRVTEFSEV